MKQTWAGIAGCLLCAQVAAPAPEAAVRDIVVYGDSSGAAIAAIAAKREGRSVVWLNPAGFPGGMSASGLGATDFLGRRNTFGGIASEFYDAVAAAYGTNYIRSFEPHVGRRVFEQLLKDAGVTVVYNERLDRTPGKGVTMDGRRITTLTTLSGKTYAGRMFIDATYVGDLMAAAGVTYTVGREPESRYGEDLAGVRRGDTKPRAHYTQGDKDHFVKEVDPYVKPGDPASGLLPHIHPGAGLANGQGDSKIQAYNYRVCLTTDPGNRIPIEKPEGYRELDHELLLRNFEAGDLRFPALVEPLAGKGRKVDWNNMHAVGSDLPGANWEYPEAGYARRREIEQAHETYIRGFLWTMANHPRVPEAIRKRTAPYGLPKDEFADNGGWPWMIYIREARRLVGDYVMTQHDCMGRTAAPDPVGLGSFGMDSHAVQLIVTENGKAQNEGVIWRVPPRPYGISYRAIVPKRGECENLFSPVCLSASHVAHGSIRMEPVFMALCQSAAIAAGLALDANVSVQDVPYPALSERLEAAKQIVRLDARRVLDLAPLHDASRVLANPHKGWYHHFPDNHPDKYLIARDADLLDFPGMEHLYIRLAWSYLEPREGQFDWAFIDRLIEKWTAHGLGIAFRISCKETGTDRVEQQYATPRWVMEAGAKGGHYRMGQAVGPEGPWEPVFDDPVFLAKLDRFLAAFAARYDAKPWLRYLDIGSIGDWGEGHCWAGSRTNLTFAVRKAHIDLHLKHFKRARLVISDDYVHALSDPDERARLHRHILDNGISYRDDSILVNGYLAGTSDRFTVRSPELFADAFLRTPTVFELEHYGAVKKLGNWDGREGSAVAKFGKGKKGPDYFRGALELLHATYIGYHGDAREWLTDNPGLTQELLNRCGYWLFPTALELPARLAAGTTAPVTLTLENRGVAPPYQPYELRVKLACEGADWVYAAGRASPSWLPGKPIVLRLELPLPATLRPGEHRVSIGLFDGSSATARAVDFALKETVRDPDGYYRIGTATIRH